VRPWSCLGRDSPLYRNALNCRYPLTILRSFDICMSCLRLSNHSIILIDSEGNASLIYIPEIGRGNIGTLENGFKRVKPRL
jgi:hypothetical protein